MADLYNRDPVDYQVFLDNTPAPLRVISYERSKGADRLDHAVLEVDLGLYSEFVADSDLANMRINAAFGARAQGMQCAIVAVLNGLAAVVHWGRIGPIEAAIGDDESIRLISRLDKS